MPIAETLEGKTYKQQCKIKADAIALVSTPKLTFQKNGITYKLSDIHVDDAKLIVTVDATGPSGPLPTDNPYVFVNPPLGVVISENPRVVAEDPLQALKEIVVGVVK